MDQGYTPLVPLLPVGTMTGRHYCKAQYRKDAMCRIFYQFPSQFRVLFVIQLIFIVYSIDNGW